MARRRIPLFAILSGLLTFAIAFRGSGRRQRERIDALRPKGASAHPAQRAADVGRGATAPQDIPPHGWWAVAKRVAVKFNENNLMKEAASITFFALLSLFPALTALVSIYGLFADPSTISVQLDTLAGFVPSGGMDIVREQVKHLTQSPQSGLGVGAIVGLAAALWSANQGSKAMFSALNDVYGEREERGFVGLTATTLAFTIGGILALVVGIALIVVIPLAFEAVGLGAAYKVAARAVGWPLALVGIVLALAVLYRFGPSRRLAQWRWVTWGGAIGGFGWMALSLGFSWYVAHFGNYNKTYGSLGAIIGFMTWIWLSSTVLLLGAQINAELETQTARDTTVGGGRPIGARGAKAADAVS